MLNHAVEPYDSVLRSGGLLDMLMGMRGDSYPGPLGGRTGKDLGAWLESSPMLWRWVAPTSQGSVCGHVALSPVGPGLRASGFADTNRLELTRLFVHPELRRSGVGRTLLRNAVRFARRQGIGLVLVVSDHLSAPIAMYESDGWRRVSEYESPLSGDRLLVFCV